MLEIWNDQLVPFLFRFNSFPGMTDYPRIVWSNPGKVDINAFMDSYQKGVNAKLITPVIEDEQHARAIMDLGDLPEGEGLEPRDGVEMPLPSGAPLPSG